jgi:hypothetical protein
LGLSHTHGVDSALGSVRWSLRGLYWFSDRFGVGMEGGGFAVNFNAPGDNIACGAPLSSAACVDNGARNGVWLAPLALFSTRLGSVRPFAGVSLGLAWMSLGQGGVGKESWVSPTVALLGGASVDLWHFTLAFDVRGDAVDDVLDATAELGLGANF